MRRDECASPLLNSALSPSPRFVGYQGDGRPHPGSLPRDKAVLRKLPPSDAKGGGNGTGQHVRGARVPWQETEVRRRHDTWVPQGCKAWPSDSGDQHRVHSVLTPGTGSRMFGSRRMLFLSRSFATPYGIIFAQCLDSAAAGGFWKVRLVHLPYRVSPAHSTLPDTGSSLRKSSCEAPRIVKEHGRGRCSLSL